MEDVVPELYRKIKSDFDRRIAEDRDIQNILNGKDTSATLADVSHLSGRTGTYALESLTSFLTEENLPDGKLYWNIMERTIIPIMREVYKVVNQMAAAVQARMDKKQKIGIKPIEPEFPLERIKAVMNKLDAIFTEDDADE